MGTSGAVALWDRGRGITISPSCCCCSESDGLYGDCERIWLSRFAFARTIGAAMACWYEMGTMGALIALFWFGGGGGGMEGGGIDGAGAT